MPSRPVTVLAIAGAAALALVALVAFRVVPVPWTNPGTDPSGPADGRLRAEFELLPDRGIAPGPGDAEIVADIVRHRLETLGVADVTVEASGPNRIAVEVPSIASGAIARRLVLPGGRIDVVPLGNQTLQEGQAVDLRANPPLFSGDQIATASVGTGDDGTATLDIQLRPEATAVFAAYTTTHIGDYIAIALDGKALSVPVIMNPIEDGDLQISFGNLAPDEDELRELVAILRFGSFPWPLREVVAAPDPTADRPLGSLARWSGTRVTRCDAASSEPVNAELLPAYPKPPVLPRGLRVCQAGRNTSGGLGRQATEDRG